MGLKEREWGQIGVINMQGTFGWIMEAPAATEYAVLPVGVEMMRPVKATEHTLSCVCVRACVRACVHVCVHVSACVCKTASNENRDLYKTGVSPRFGAVRQDFVSMRKEYSCVN